MANLQQISVNASKCQIYDKKAKMLQNNIHGTHIDEEGSVILVGRISSQKMGIFKENLCPPPTLLYW